MVEPTESESKAELDRFIDAMIAIRDEDPRDRGRRARPRRQSAEACAAHGGGGVRATTGRTRTRAALRGVSGRVAQASAKYWPPVARVDNVYGDRNLFCSCIPVASRRRSEAHIATSA